MQGPGSPGEDRSGGFERGGWTTPLFDNETATFVKPAYQRATLLTFPVVVGQGTRLFPDTALELVESGATPAGERSRSIGPTGTRSTERPPSI